MQNQASAQNIYINQGTDNIILFYLRIIFYIIFALKLIQIVFRKNRKPGVKQRIQRKFIFAHGEMIKNYNKEEVQMMQQTLFNTLKNATQPFKPTKNDKKLKKSKTVSFTFENNQYYDPPKFQNTTSAILETVSEKSTLTPKDEIIIPPPIIQQSNVQKQMIAQQSIDEESPLIQNQKDQINQEIISI